VCSGPKYHLPYNDDGVHLTADGYTLLGERVAAVFFEVVVLGRPWQPLQPVAVARGGDGDGDRRSVVVTFHVPSPPLRWWATDTDDVVTATDGAGTGGGEHPREGNPHSVGRHRALPWPHLQGIGEWRRGRGFELLADGAIPVEIESVELVEASLHTADDDDDDDNDDAEGDDERDGDKAGTTHGGLSVGGGDGGSGETSTSIRTSSSSSNNSSSSSSNSYGPSRRRFRASSKRTLRAIRITATAPLPASGLTVAYALTAMPEIPAAGSTRRLGHLCDSDPLVGVASHQAQPNFAVAFDLDVPDARPDAAPPQHQQPQQPLKEHRGSGNGEF
jgi:hypothetical protein